MTDEPNDDLEQRLRRDLGEIADAVPVDEAPSAATNVVPISAASERRRRPVLAIAGVVGAAAALLIGVLIWQSDDDGPGENVVTSDPAATPAGRPDDAPPAADSPVGFWLSERRIPVEGADLGVVLAGRSDDSFGASASVDRWTGTEWEKVRFAAPCLDHWHCIGELHPATSPPVVRQIELALDEGGLGDLMLLHIEGLEPGWYRLHAEGAAGDTAEGQFEVVDEDLSLPEFGDVSGVRLLVHPPFVATAGSVVDVVPSTTESLGPEEIAEAEAGLSFEVRFLQWTDGSWVDVASQPVTTVPQPADGESLVTVEVPALEPGAYQLVRDGTDGSAAVGLLWAISPQVPVVGQAAPTDPTTSRTTVSAPSVAAGCPTLPGLDGAIVHGETLSAAVQATPADEPVVFGADEGGAETFVASDRYRVAAALPVRPVIDFVGERTAQEGPVLLWWAGDDRAEAWVMAEGCDTVGISVTGGTRDQNAQAAADLAHGVAGDVGLATTPEPATDCPEPQSGTGGSTMLFYFCPFDDVDQIPRPVAPRDPFIETPEQALQALFDTAPPAGWGTAVPLEMRGADVGVNVTDGVARLDVDYDFQAAPIGNFSASAWALAYSGQLQATLFQFPEVEAIDFDTVCCGEWGGGDPGTRAEWETWLAQATEP